MIIYPDIEVKDGKCVILRRGSFDDPKVYDIEPLAAAKRFEASGAEYLHVVDLDGVLQGGRHNAETIVEIIETVSIPVQVGGGIRTMATADWWMEHGAARIVLGTAAIKDRTFVRNACARYPGKVVVSLDARDGYVMVDGWREQTGFTASEIAKDLADSGVAAIVFTDIDAQEGPKEATFAETSALGQEIAIPLISSGCVQSLDDVSVLRHIPGIHGTIIGWAFYERWVSVRAALAVAREPATEAEFI
ncbi:1-(5-phosphoribosyl)-5-((5-phosphoribosylamino)methylideneamino)imidazole-4-carboxamide isomerase [Marivibrio halodurans]|uniref:1-(5-phosphoribosyl)-5-[(5-phosphoribosylamino)methylideneamino] imidazole-4-carboxamide isomerase n=1 Tax=Marivibrio halodurans TaxID=2039722 RepID=A0A8J7V131_9PROT|nr:HisA/HisF-related TIM barrel protein [Marivibrio halodurans]MBP5855885.1 1-(5-phosphoribosyl)-5-((5-phosphoribosylamino)methylideneamino)imidazole-4-carboxamide isomerase [Marivibrio halodurans]